MVVRVREDAWDMIGFKAANVFKNPHRDESCVLRMLADIQAALLNQQAAVLNLRAGVAETEAAYTAIGACNSSGSSASTNEALNTSVAACWYSDA
jgi:hypothetical protein